MKSGWLLLIAALLLSLSACGSAPPNETPMPTVDSAVPMMDLAITVADLAVDLAADLGPPACVPPSLRCEGVCVDITVDTRNCGACGSACPPGNFCSGGRCTPTCPRGATECKDGCYDLMVDRNHCGNCATVCAPGKVCSAGSCELSCQVGLSTCPGPGGPVCVDLQTHDAHCGACGKACPMGTRCTAGACVLSCQANLTDCGGRCVDLQVDNGNCGACGMACGPGQLCSTGKCAANCNAPLAACMGACVDPRFDPSHCGGCGMTCSPTNVLVAACFNGMCAGTCAPGFGDCDQDRRGNGCEIDLTTDLKNCGVCGKVCPPLPNAVAGCAAGVCGIASCAMGWKSCDGNDANGCEVDLTTSLMNCGNCGVACAAASATSSCQKGVCKIDSCKMPNLDCDGKYANGCETNPQTDVANCGACGMACKMGLSCVRGVCGRDSIRFIAAQDVKIFGGNGPPFNGVVGDLDKDGALDFVAKGGNVAMGVGDGTFRDAVSIGGFGDWARLADFNGDGKLDMLRLNQNGANNFYAGNGDGTFAAPKQLVGATLNEDFVLGDWNGDGKIDLATPRCINTLVISIATGRGDGTFQVQPDATGGKCNSARGLVAGDWNGDGKTDLAVSTQLASPGNGMEVLVSKGDGTFQASVGYVGTDFSEAIGAADFDGDGNLDLAGLTVTNTGGGVLFWKGVGNGTFVKGSASTWVGPAPNEVAVGDMNGDGKPDVITGQRCQGDARVLTGDGKGGFAVNGPLYQFGLDGWCVLNDMSVADLNNDKKLDLIGGVFYMLGNGDGTLQAGTDLALPANSLGAQAAGGDLDGDGNQDVVIAAAGLTPFFGNGDGSFTAGAQLDVGAFFGAGVADLNGDKVLDLVGGGFGTVVSYTGSGNRKFVLASTRNTGINFSVSNIVDVNGDGRLDALVSAYGTSRYLPGAGNGALNALAGSENDGPIAFVYDFNGDKLLDLLAGKTFFAGMGNGIFAAGKSAGIDGGRYAVADVNKDGKPDVVLGGRAQLGKGDGTFAPYGTGVFGPTIGTTVADFDGDGNLDVASAYDPNGLVQVCAGLGDGNFSLTCRLFRTVNGNYDLIALDVNKDGKPDLVTVSNKTNIATVLINSSP